jgi:hypothetical protein
MRFPSLCRIGIHTADWFAYDYQAVLVPQWWKRSFMCKYRHQPSCNVGTRYFINWRLWQWTVEDWCFQIGFVWPRNTRLAHYIRCQSQRPNEIS